MSAPVTRRDLERSVQDLHESYWEREREASRGKTVLLVEGDDDADLVGRLFRHRKLTWATTLRIVVAGGRTRVLEKMASFPPGYGLVDRDTWTDDDVRRMQIDHPHLHVTRGWCIENELLGPTWLRAHRPRAAERLAPERETWVRAGALWWTLQRAREAQQRWQEALGWTYGAPHANLDVSDARALARSLERYIPRETRRAATFDLDQVTSTFDERVRDVLALDHETQWRIGVHGKRAFRVLLIPALQAEGDQRSQLNELVPALGRPPPLDTLMAMLFP